MSDQVLITKIEMSRQIDCRNIERTFKAVMSFNQS